MGFNWKSVISTLNAFRTPEQAINWMLERGAKKDPQLASSLKKMINAKEDASKVLVQLSSEGKITLKQLATIKNYYDIARRMGFKQQIPNEYWMKAEQAIKSGNNGGSTPKKKFTGF